MTDHRKLLKQASDALAKWSSGRDMDAVELNDLVFALAEPEPVAWSTREMFYKQIDRAVENMRQRMTIRTVTMRCKDFDVALPIIDSMEGHVLVGYSPFQRPLLTDEEISDVWCKHYREGFGHEQMLELIRAIERKVRGE